MSYGIDDKGFDRAQNKFWVPHNFEWLARIHPKIVFFNGSNIFSLSKLFIKTEKIGFKKSQNAKFSTKLTRPLAICLTNLLCHNGFKTGWFPSKVRVILFWVSAFCRGLKGWPFTSWSELRRWCSALSLGLRSGIHTAKSQHKQLWSVRIPVVGSTVVTQWLLHA